jgi:hypothetical protein
MRDSEFQGFFFKSPNCFKAAAREGDFQNLSGNLANFPGKAAAATHTNLEDRHSGT